jgi:hypothetical protein
VTDRPRAWLVVVGAVVAAVVAVLVLRQADGPPVGPRPSAAALASPGLAPGRVGGLLPDVVLSGRSKPENARALRPAVVMLVAPDCGCVDALRHVVREAAAYRLVTYVVQAGDLAQPVRLAAQAAGDVGPFADPNGALAAAYGLHTDAALVLVRADGVVTQTVAAVGPALRLGPALRALLG